MDSHIECEQFNIKHEVDPLSVTEIKIEPHNTRIEVNTESGDSDDLSRHNGITHEICLSPHVVASVNTISTDNKYNIKTEAEECDEYPEDFKYEIPNITHIVTSLLEVENTNEKAEKMLKYREEKLQEKNREENEFNVPCETCKISVEEVNCGTLIFGHPKQKTYTHRQSNTCTDIEEFNCNNCNNSFSSESELTAHVCVNTGKRSLMCNVCRKSFFQKSHLTEHIRIHTNEKPFTCSICRKSYSRNSILMKHALTHTNEKPFTCSLCSKSFSQKSHLATHIHTHSIEKPFRCSFCTKSFSQKPSLVEHIRTHTKEKPLTCKICNKAFNHKSTFSRHLRTHSNDKPYICIFCKKLFTQKCYLNRHTLKYHRLETRI